jgi:hypothetical protein
VPPPKFMTESPWNQPATNVSQPAAPRTVSGVVVALGVIAGAAVAGGAAWWLQGERVAAKERERAEAAEQLGALAQRVQAAEARAAEVTERLKQSDAKGEAAAKQLSETAAQIDQAKRDAADARTERDGIRSQFNAAKSELDRVKAADLDPGALPSLELARVFAGTTAVRSSVDLQVVGQPAPGLDKAAVEASVAAALKSAAIEPGPQSTFRVAVFATLGREQPQRPLGVMMLLLRSMKVPGEGGSREVAVWGQQRLGAANDAQAAQQLQLLVEELCRELAATVKPGSPAAPAGGASPPPAAGNATP